jgi:hypothetical protein
VGLIACAVSLITLQQFFFMNWQASLEEPFRAIG